MKFRKNTTDEFSRNPSVSTPGKLKFRKISEWVFQDMSIRVNMMVVLTQLYQALPLHSISIMLKCAKKTVWQCRWRHQRVIIHWINLIFDFSHEDYLLKQTREGQFKTFQSYFLLKIRIKFPLFWKVTNDYCVRQKFWNDSIFIFTLNAYHYLSWVTRILTTQNWPEFKL